MGFRPARSSAPVPLTIDLPPETLAALRASAAEHGRTLADEAAARLADGLAVADGLAEQVPASAGASGRPDWTGDPLAAAFSEKVARLRENPDAFAAGAPDPFVAALEAERAAGSAARDAA